MDTCGIYRIFHKGSGKSYIGQSLNIKQRLRTHKWRLSSNQHDNQHLQNAWNKYGNDSFEWQTLEICERTELNEKEQFWIDTANAMFGVYNIALIIDGTSKSHSEETRRKMSESLKGRKVSEETKLKLREGMKRFLSTPAGDEFRRKISEEKKGKKISEQGRLNMAAARRARAYSQKLCAPSSSVRTIVAQSENGHPANCTT